MKFHRSLTEEEKYLEAIKLHTNEAQKFDGWAAQCHNPRTKADYQHSANSSREAAKREQGNLDAYRLKRAAIPVQASLMEVA